jgi:tetratricopeptide (TPR) repeat protein
MRIIRLIALGIVAGALAGCQDRARTAELQGGYASLQHKEYEQARMAAERVLARDPAGAGAAEAHYLRGRALEQRTKPDDLAARADFAAARAAYFRALGLASGPALQAHIHTSLGNVCYWLEDYAAAEVHCRAAASLLAPGDLHAWVLYRMGLCQQRLGKWAAADGTFATIERQYRGTEAARRSVERRGAREFYVQVSAFSNPDSAEKFLRTLHGQGFPAVRLYKPDRKLHIALAGPLRDYAQATAMRSRLHTQGYKDAFIVP